MASGETFKSKLRSVTSPHVSDEDIRVASETFFTFVEQKLSLPNAGSVRGEREFRSPRRSVIATALREEDTRQQPGIRMSMDRAVDRHGRILRRKAALNNFSGSPKVGSVTVEQTGDMISIKYDGGNGILLRRKMGENDAYAVDGVYRVMRTFGRWRSISSD